MRDALSGGRRSIIRAFRRPPPQAAKIVFAGILLLADLFAGVARTHATITPCRCCVVPTAAGCLAAFLWCPKEQTEDRRINKQKTNHPPRGEGTRRARETPVCALWWGLGIISCDARWSSSNLLPTSGESGGFLKMTFYHGRSLFGVAEAGEALFGKLYNHEE
jgi:hypothetical protein